MVSGQTRRVKRRREKVGVQLVRLVIWYIKSVNTIVSVRVLTVCPSAFPCSLNTGIYLEHLIWCARSLDDDSPELWKRLGHRLDHPGIVPPITDVDDVEGAGEGKHIEEGFETGEGVLVAA